MGKTLELLSLLKTGNSDAARRLIAKFKKAGKKKALAKELNVPDDNGQTVIHFCAAQNFVEFLQDLAELGASVDLADNKGYTPLHLAAASGRTSAVTALIAMGADPNISSRTGDTALHLACHGGHATSVEALVKENANCTMLNVSGYTPLDLASQSGHAQVVSLLLRSGQFSASYLQRSDMPHTALMLAAKQGHNECIALLLKHGFDVNRKLPGGSGGTALHEAALYGRVDTVRYLIQCGVDVQKTNAQGHTALDIVNMYTDPRTANAMKQVLQDALAQLARSRIAQQHGGQHPAPTATHRTPFSAVQQPPGFSYFPVAGPPGPHGQMLEGPAHRKHYQTPTQRQASQPRPSAAYPHHPKGQLSGHPSQSAGHPYQSVGHPHQPAVGHYGHSQQPSGRPHLTTDRLAGHPQQLPSADHSYTGLHPSGQRRQDQPLPSVHAENPAAAQLPPPQNVQHIYPKPGTPEAVRKAPGIGGDLAAIIAAKAASRKPIVTSPTQKESVEEGDERLARSMTVGGEPGLQQARTAANQRSSSVSDRGSTSPERGDVASAPTLPRRLQAGPPAFKPVPPPSEEPRGQGLGSELEGSAVFRRVSSGEPQVQKPPPRPAPDSTPEDNELMQKLKRRQNKITEAEQAAPEPAPVTAEEMTGEEEESPSSKPPPPPQRKTPALNSTTQPAAPTEQALSEPFVLGKQKIKPPPPKPKEAEPEMSPWQQELAARKARMADHENESEQHGGSDGHQDQLPPAPVPKLAPKPKKSKAPPPAVVPPMPVSFHEQPLPEAPAHPQPPALNVSVPSAPVPLQPQWDQLSSDHDLPVGQEPPGPPVVMEEAERPALPAGVSTLAVSSTDQLSRSTSMSSLTAGTGSPQLSHAEHLPILEWLSGYKMAEYAPMFEGNGYDTTELLVGIPHEELQEIGITKIGHRKKLISALSGWPQKDQFFQVKPESVSLWLSVLHMSQYEQAMVEAGYDDIDFISEMTLDDLQDIGVSKRGHVKRLLQGIGELTELAKSFPSHVSEDFQASPLALPSETANHINKVIPEEPVLPPPKSWTGGASTEDTDFSQIRGLLEMKMGTTYMQECEEVPVCPPPSLPAVPPSLRRGFQHPQPEEFTSDILPQIPPKRNLQYRREGEVDARAGKSFSVEDITTALGEAASEEQATDGGNEGEFDAALQGLSGDTDLPAASEPEPDQLLADIDDMLADLTTHLDFMIPGST